MSQTGKRDTCRGNSLVEFAIAFTFISALFIGVFEFGYTFYLYNNLATNIRAGARYAAQKPYTPAPGSSADNPIPSSAFSNAVKNMVVYGSHAPADNARPVVPGLTTANVEIVPAVDSNAVPFAITVRVSRTTPFMLNAVLATKRLAGKPAVTFPYTGVYSPAL